MIFRQPNNRHRLMHQLLDQMERGTVVTLRCGSDAELQRAIEALDEVARERRIGVVISAGGRRTVDLRLAAAAA